MDNREQKRRRQRGREQVFLFDESVTSVLASPDAALWEIAIADHGGRIDVAAQELGLSHVPRNAKALWGISAEEARSTYRAFRRRSKQKQSRIPRHKRMNREARLQSARAWLAKYPGKNVVNGYRKHFGVDFDCALIELEMLGVEIDRRDVKSHGR